MERVPTEPDWNLLPSEIWLQVFRWLDLGDLVQAERTTSRWCHLLRTEVVSRFLETGFPTTVSFWPSPFAPLFRNRRGSTLGCKVPDARVPDAATLHTSAGWGAVGHKQPSRVPPL